MEQTRIDSRILHPEVHSISRDTVKTEGRVTRPYFTKYEYVTLIGTRAQQLAEGAKALVSLNGMTTSDPQFVWKVAEKEVLEQKLPFIIHRRIPNGISEYWSASELTAMW
jgi:DNA-directed RNA polymerase I, II, and III subunit RPABC2